LFIGCYKQKVSYTSSNTKKSWDQKMENKNVAMK